jgi:uncharacterized protein YktB (UPF0637 family)
MAGLGIGPEDFDIFGIEDPEKRAQALEDLLSPKLLMLGRGVVAGLSRVVGRELHPHLSRVVRRKSIGPGEVFVAFCESPKGFRGLPVLAIAVTLDQLHARVAVRGECGRCAAMKLALEREAQSLSRKGKPFRRLRCYSSWDHRELPEIAPAHSQAFWLEMAAELAPAPRRKPPLFDVGIAWPRDEACSLAVGDVLGVFRDLAPLYKLLAHAG